MNRMVLVLQRSETQEKALQAAIQAMHDPSSPQFHHWLTPQQFGSLYGPADADIATVTSWLTGRGFQVNAVAKGKGTIEFSGTAELVASAFHTSMHTFEVNGKQHVANQTPASIPRALTPVVAGILSLNDFMKTADARLGGKMRIATDAEGHKSLQPETNLSNGTHGVGPGDLWTIYNSLPLITAQTNAVNGTGQTIAIVGRSDLLLDDITQFRKTFLPAPYSATVPFTQIQNGPDPGISGDDALEQALDVEYSSAMAPAAQIDLVVSASTNSTDGVDLSAQYIVDNNLAGAMSTSYGDCEAGMGLAENQFYNGLWEQAAAQGITATVSAGDNGSAGCDLVGPSGTATADVADEGLEVSGLASTPYNVAVGGNEFTNDTTTYWSANNNSSVAPFVSALSYVPEEVWNESCSPAVCGNEGADIAAGSGGKSGCFTPTLDAAGNITACSGGYAEPDWQTGVMGLPSDGARHLPDVALTASSHDGYILCFGGSCDQGEIYVVGGTSASSPSFAGVMALVDQKTGSRQGQANYTLYRLAANEYGSTASPNTANLTSCNAGNGNTIGSQCIFQDVTTGTNAVPCDGGTLNCSSTTVGVVGVLTGYATGTGYDSATGLGSVNIANLVNHWNDVTRTGSATSLTLGAATSTFGQAIPITVAVTPSTGTGTPTGNVSLVTDAGAGAGVVTLTNGAYSGSFSSLPGGTYHVSAQYAGDTNYSGSTSPSVAVTVTPAASTVQLSFSASDAVTGAGFAGGAIPYGSVVSANATAVGVKGQLAPSGNMSFLSGAKTLATEISDATGFATYASQGYAIGSYTWTASFAGNGNYQASVSPASTFTVTPAATSMRLLSSSSYVVGTSTATITATVLDDSFLNNPTGTVTFSVNGTAVGTGQLTASMDPSTGTSEGVATFTLAASLLKTGANQITASYAGDSNYAVSTSPALPIGYSVNVPANTIALAASTLTPTVGQAVTLTATVTTGGIPATSGTVNFFDGANLLATAQVAGANAAKGITPGTAVLQTILAPGTHNVKAVYTGILASPTAVSSSVSSIAVTGTTKSTTSLSAAADNANPKNYDFTATVTGYGFALPSNTVDFSETSVLADFGPVALNTSTLIHTFTPPALSSVPDSGSLSPFAGLAADFNGDGIPDLATADPNGALSVLLGNGDGTYRGGTTYAAGSYAINITSGDFNGDGIVDLMVTAEYNSSFSGGQVSVYLGNGDGTFQEQIAYTPPGFSVQTVVGDFNRDGILDLATLQYYPMQISVAFGNGDGTFGQAVSYDVGYEDFSAYSIATADFNGDGALDLVEINQADQSAEVYLNSGTGAFSESVNLTTDSGPQWVTTADVNGDGKQDVITSNYGAGTVGVFLGNGDGTFQAQASYPVDGVANSLTVADLNGDGKLDIAGAYYVLDSLAPTSAIGVIYGNGDGTFGAVKDIATTQGHDTYVVVADLNGDGTPDLVALDGTYGDNSSQTIATLLNVTQGTAVASNVTVFGPANTQQQVVASYAGDLHYSASSSGGVSVVSYGTKQTPVIAWTPVGAWGIGVPLGTQVLNAAVTTAIPGAITYTAQLGTGAAVAVTPATTLSTGGLYVFTATFTPTDTNSYNTVTATSTVSIVPVDYNVVLSSTAVTIISGKSATLTANVVGLYGFSGQVAFSTAGTLPGGVTVTESPAAVGPGGASTITIQTSALPAAHAALDVKPGWTVWGAGGLAAAGLLCLPLLGRRRRVLAGRVLASTICAACLVLASGCSSHYSHNTNVTLTSSAATAASGTPVTLTAVVTGGHSNFTGTVTFYNGDTALGSAVSVNGSVATLQVAMLPVGLDMLTATYTGDGENAGATSNTLPELITGQTSVQIVGTSGSISHISNVQVTIQ